MNNLCITYIWPDFRKSVFNVKLHKFCEINDLELNLLSVKKSEHLKIKAGSKFNSFHLTKENSGVLVKSWLSIYVVYTQIHQI